MRSCFPSARRLALFLIEILALVGYSFAQSEVEIMVSGPWAYVADPDNTKRIVIIAPDAPHHGPVTIFSGEDAAQYANQIKPFNGSLGSYNLDFATDCTSTQHPPDTYHIGGVSPDAVRKLIKGPGGRYAISLPIPCSYTVDQSSRFKIDSTDPTKAPDVSYANLMILHYSLTGDANAVISGAPDGGQPVKDTRAFSSLHDGDPPAISIVFGTDSPWDTDPDCDSTSNISFRKAIALFQPNSGLHVLFPRVTRGAPGH